MHNLGLLGVHPSTIDAIVISHGHYDHTGGLVPLLEQAAKTMPVYAHPNIFAPRYSVAGGSQRYIGIPWTKEQLTSLGAKWRLSREPVQVIPGLVFGGEIPRLTAYETGDPNLVGALAGADKNCGCGATTQDPLPDDSALFYSTPSGLVVIGGCTHAGLVNTVRHGLNIMQSPRLAGWIGGTHLGPASAGQKSATIEELTRLNPDFVAANHCTGFAMLAKLHHIFGDKFVAAGVGTVIDC